MSEIKAFDGEMMSDHQRPTSARRLNMTIMAEPGFTAVCAALIAAVAWVSPAASQQPPASSTSPQVTPAQPGSMTKLYDMFGPEQKKIADGIPLVSWACRWE
ncbi:MAG: hypothetical protein HYX37_13005 [Rhizobiales bacterium]|nr:hypothetical protein [Hyphomicrobiales bacterium]